MRAFKRNKILPTAQFGLAAMCFFGMTAWASAQPLHDSYFDYHGTMGHNKHECLPSGVVSRQRVPGTKIWGCDISKWQDSVDFGALASGVSFVVIRASYGTLTDPLFSSHRAGAEGSNIETGFYHYAYPQYNNNPQDEANHFCDVVGHLNPGEFVALDIEEKWSGDVVGWCKSWLDTVQSRLGVRPLLYTYLYYETLYNWASIINANYGLWIADYVYNKNADPPSTQWPFAAMFQYSDRESVPGIPTGVDGDVFFGSLDQLKKYGLQGTPASVSWSSTPPQNVWYRSDEHLVYHVGGDMPNTVQEMIQGNVTATYQSITDGYIAFSYGSPGWHYYQVGAQNAWNSGQVLTDQWVGGYDPDPPTATRAGGALPQTWYSDPATTVTFSCSALATVRQCHYRWDEGLWSDWQPVNSGTVTLPQGQHHLFVEVENNAVTPTDSTGARATYDLGEYWLSTTRPIVTALWPNGGWINPSGIDPVPYGSTLTLYAGTNPGFHLVDWRVDGIIVQTGGSSLTLTNIQANHTVSVDFAQWPVLLVPHPLNGDLSETGKITIPPGTDYTVTAYPYPYYTVGYWALDGATSLTASGQPFVGTHFTLKQITSNHTLAIKFVPLYVHASAGPGGSVSPVGSVPAVFDGNLTFRETAARGYDFIGWVLDGKLAQTGGAAFSIYDIEGYHNIYAAFSPWSVTSSASQGGWVTPHGSMHVSPGQNVTYSAYPYPGWTIAGWLVDGQVVQNGGSSFTLSDIQGSHTVKVTFRTK